ncbi:MAG: M56 family metallopeptidase [Lawsonibacter sp.]|jgi:beta-lactamase regulating signal transducer with metallopeptidase domain
MSAIFIPVDAVLQWVLPFLPSLQRLGEWAVSSSVLIVIVLALGGLLKEKLSCRVRYALWGVVLVRLLLPLQLPFSLPVSSAQVVPDAPAAWETTWVPVFPSQPQDIDEAHPYYQDFAPGYKGPGPWSQGYVERSEDGETVTTYLDCFTQAETIQLVWGVGVLATLLLVFIPNLRFARRLERRRKNLEIPGCPLPIYEVEGLPSPCLFGMLRPAIYLSSEAVQLPEGERRHVLAHELTHYAHKDHIWAALRCVCLALHWYNPLVWLAVICTKRDGELACDEGTIANLGEAERIPYGRTLVGLVARRSLRPGDLVSCSTAMTGGKNTIQQRIALLVKKPETQKTALFLALSLVVLAVVFTFAQGKTIGAVADYNSFKEEIRQAQAIGYGPPVYSSQVYPDSITDEDLMEKARSLLYDNARDLLTSVKADWSQLLLQASTLTLVNQRGEEIHYFLCPWEGDIYVLTPARWDAEKYIPVVAYSEDIPVMTALENLARQQRERNGGNGTPLSQEEVEFFSQWLDWSHTSIQAQFLTSLYSRPQEINLYELFYNGSRLEEKNEPTPEQYAAIVEDVGYEPQVSLSFVTKEDMSAVLLAYTGLTLDQTEQLGLENFAYLPELELYYSWHGDTNLDVVKVSGGIRAGDLVYLNYTFGSGEERRMVTLRQTEAGYQFISNKMMEQIQTIVSPVGLRFESQGQDFNQVAQDFGVALLQAYFGTPPREAKVELGEWEVAETLATSNSPFCVRLSLLVDPGEAESLAWIAGDNLVQTGDGTYRLIWEYCLEQEESGWWICTQAGADVPLKTVWRVEYPEFKAQLTELFLNDEECIELNETPDGEMAQWLMDWTTFYDVKYGRPWMQEKDPERWYARAVDAGSWYTITIPDHLVKQVVQVCQKQEYYPGLEEIHAVLEQASMVQIFQRGQWNDQDGVKELAQQLEVWLGSDTRMQHGRRVKVGDLYPITFTTEDGHWVEFYIQETGEDCLLAAGRRDGVREDTLPVLAILPAGSWEMVESWVQRMDSTPQLNDYSKSILEAMTSLTEEKIQEVSLERSGPMAENWGESLNWEKLARLIRQAAAQPLAKTEEHSDTKFIDYGLWNLVVTTETGKITLMAGQVEDQVSIAEGVHLTNCSELYDLIRQGVGSG